MESTRVAIIELRNGAKLTPMESVELEVNGIQIGHGLKMMMGKLLSMLVASVVETVLKVRDIRGIIDLCLSIMKY